MTAKTHRKPKHRHKQPRRRRNSMLESFGFSETQSVSYVAKGRHLAQPVVARPRVRVEEEFHADPMVDSVADWTPIEVDRSGLNRRMRWSLVVLWTLIIGGVGAAAFWLYTSPNAAAESAVAAVTADASDLESALQGLESVAAGLDVANVDPVDGASAAMAAVDEASRALFASSGLLSERDSSLRLAATDASTQALDASRTLNTASAYLAAVGPILTTPTLETDPEVIDLATAATDFGTWISRFDQVRNALPESVLSKVSSELSRISSSLEATQRAYLDALREDDREATLEVVRGLEGSIVEAWAVLGTETDALRDSILARINSATEALDSLG